MKNYKVKPGSLTAYKYMVAVPQVTIAALLIVHQKIS